MTTATPTTTSSRHRETLQRALTAIRERTYWSAYPESLKAYGEDTGSQSAAEGKAAFDGYLGRPFPLEQAATDGDVVGERSPYGIDLGVTYPHADLDRMLGAATAAIPSWRDAGPDVRADVALEILHRVNARSHEMAQAVMHTSGQAYAMAFQAGGPHAQDRALEAVAYAYAEMTRHAERATWEKPQGKRPPQRMAKTFTVVPRGVALVIGCNTFPTWNSYPGLFASLVTGNAVVVKPHPRAVLPLAITVQIAREVLAEAGYSPDLVQLAAEQPGRGSGEGSGPAARGEGHRLHRVHRVRHLAGAQRAPGCGLHREGRCQHRRRRLHRRLPRDAREPRVLAVAVQRPDVHHPAEPARPPRRDHRRRGTQGRSTSWAPTSPPPSTGCSATTRARPRCSARW